MRAIILAAGTGQRLAEQAAGRPKCLLEFGAVSLLQRHIDNLAQLGVKDILIVTGYRANEIEDRVRHYAGDVAIATVFNPEFESGSVISLLCAREVLESGEQVLIMDADVLYHPAILQRLDESANANCFLLDREFEAGEEPVKICVRDMLMVDFRKQIDGALTWDFQGESVGFFKFENEIAKALAQRCLYYIEQGSRESPYEEAIRDLLLRTPERFGFEDITGLPWIEIDFPEDARRAEKEILEQINQFNDQD